MKNTRTGLLPTLERDRQRRFAPAGSSIGLALAWLVTVCTPRSTSAGAPSDAGELSSRLPSRGPAVVVIGVVQTVSVRHTEPPPGPAKNAAYSLVTLRVEECLFGTAPDTVRFGTYTARWTDESGELNEVSSAHGDADLQPSDRALVVLYDAQGESSWPNGAPTSWWCRLSLLLEHPPEHRDQPVSYRREAPQRPPEPDASDYPFLLAPRQRSAADRPVSPALEAVIAAMLAALRANGIEPGSAGR